MTGDPIGVRIQRLGIREQVLILAEITQLREARRTTTAVAVSELFHELGLPAPSKVSNDFGALCKSGLLAKGKERGQYRVTPLGRTAVERHVSQLDVAALEAEVAAAGGSELGRALHSLVPPSLAPPALIQPLRNFLAAHPFDNNVFGMTRFPDAKAGTKDPVGQALEVARTVCEGHGLQFHLASDRAIHDDLWTNVTAHMWASRYGIGFFEDRVERGLNHNLTIEIGGMLVTGRRCALLKDGSIDRMPVDLVGFIYKAVDLGNASSVAEALHRWIRDDLALMACAQCPM